MVARMADYRPMAASSDLDPELMSVGFSFVAAGPEFGFSSDYCVRTPQHEGETSYGKNSKECG